MHERFIEFLKKHEGVEFVPAEFICNEYVFLINFLANSSSAHETLGLNLAEYREQRSKWGCSFPSFAIPWIVKTFSR